MRAVVLALLLLPTTVVLSMGQPVPPSSKDPIDQNQYVFNVDDGAFHVIFPGDLNQEDPNGSRHSYRGIPSWNAPKSEHDIGKDPCSHTLTLVGIGGDVTREMSTRGDNKSQFLASPPSGGKIGRAHV